MNRKTWIAVSIVICFASALAQPTPTFTLRAHIPFDFVVQNDTLPAGDYRLQIPGPNPGPIMVRQMAGDKREELILQVPVQENWTGGPQLTFDKVGNAYYLVQVSDPRAGVQRVQQGKRYKDERKLASAQPVTVAAR